MTIRQWRMTTAGVLTLSPTTITVKYVPINGSPPFQVFRGVANSYHDNLKDAKAAAECLADDLAAMGLEP